MSKVDRAASQAPLKLIAPNKPRALESVKAPAAQSSVFATPAAKSGPGLRASEGVHLARSARPDALWGAETPAKPVDAQLESFLKLPQPERRAKLQEVRAERDQLNQQIQDRLATLDIKWDSIRTSSKQELLHDFEEQALAAMDEPAKAEFTELLEKADAAQGQIDQLRSLRERMGPARNATGAQKEARARINKELRELRKEQSTCVKEATQVVDDQGLKVDRLASAEQKLDPNAPPKESGKSLFGMVASWFKLSTWINVLTVLTDTVNEGVKKNSIDRTNRQQEIIDADTHAKGIHRRELLGQLHVALHTRSK